MSLTLPSALAADAQVPATMTVTRLTEVWETIMRESHAPGELETREEFAARLEAFVAAKLPPVMFEVDVDWSYEADSGVAVARLARRTDAAADWVTSRSSRVFLVARVGTGPAGAPSLGFDGGWSDLQQGVPMRERTIWIGSGWLVVTDPLATSVRGWRPVRLTGAVG